METEDEYDTSGICWYCYWGWPEQVSEIFEGYKQFFGDNDGPLRWGPGHIVWEDENFGDSSIKFCIEEARKEIAARQEADKRSELENVLDSLEELLAVPLEIREPWAAGYEESGQGPGKWPPREGIVLVRQR